MPYRLDFKVQKMRRVHVMLGQWRTSPWDPELSNCILISNPERKHRKTPYCTFHSVMQESLDAVTTISSCLLEWRPQILSSWPSNVFTHSFVLIVQSFKRPSEPLLEKKETQQTSLRESLDRSILTLPHLKCQTYLSHSNAFQTGAELTKNVKGAWEFQTSSCQYYQHSFRWFLLGKSYYLCFLIHSGGVSRYL